MLPLPSRSSRRRLLGRRLCRFVTTLAIAAAPLTVLVITPPVAHAAPTVGCDAPRNYVVNCGFETRDLTGWSVVPAASGSHVYVGSSTTGYALIFGGTASQDDTVYQQISDTVPGHTYTVSFQELNLPSTHSHLAASVMGVVGGNVSIFDATDQHADGQWHLRSATFTASSLVEPVLEISGYNGSTGVLVDNVVVVDNGPALPLTLPAATYGTAYSGSVAATGGAAPYTYSMTSGDLPAGLSLNTADGTVHGTPTTVGDATFTITVTDSEDPAETATQTYTLSVAKANPTVAVTAPTVGGVVGESADITATSTSDENAITFASGSSATCSLSGHSVTYLHPGDCVIFAGQAESADYNAASDIVTIAVTAAATTTAVHVHPGSISADVDVVAPGSGDPTGTVTFSVGGDVVGTAPVSGHQATLDYNVPSGATRQVAAVYGGDTDFTGSSDSTARQDPSITATVTSAHGPHAGWYRTPVRISFTCTPHGADLTTPCPAPVTIGRNVAGASVTRSVLSADGGADTVAVSGINVDRTAPAVRVAGIHNGATYGGHAPAARCVGTDRLSGIASCRITRHTARGLTRYTATAKDKAGNTATAHGSYRVLSTYLVGAPYRHGAFQVRPRAYSLVTHASSRPRYVDAAPVPRKPHGLDNYLTRTGPHTWAVTVSLAGLPRHSSWNLGILVGGHLRVVRVHVM